MIALVSTVLGIFPSRTVQRGAGIISVNGAAAHKADPGDILIIATYAMYSELELQKFHPQLVYVDEYNHIIAERDEIMVQAA